MYVTLEFTLSQLTSDKANIYEGKCDEMLTVYIWFGFNELLLLFFSLNWCLTALICQ